MLKTRMHLLFLLAGVGIAVFLGIHMFIQHLNNVFATGDTDPTSWLSMIGRSLQGSWILIYILLLLFGLYHGLYGLRGIILEMTKSERAVSAVNWIFVVGGILLFIWASYVPIMLASK
jgi:succinate dehydrogenase hydrophobic anchor subunit